MPLIDKELRRARQERSIGIPQEPRKRRRLDKVDFQLKVYDLAERGQTFSAIARRLNRRLSTVKSAYLAAGLSILGSPLGKKTVPLVDFNSSAHIEECTECQTAKTPEKLCARARAFMRQDHVGQREL